MQAGDLTRASLDRLLVAAERLGVSRARVAKFMPPSDAERVELLDYCRLGQSAISLSGRGDLGLEIASVTAPTHLGFSGLAVISAPTLGEALTLLTRYEPLSVRSYRGQSRWIPSESKLSFYSVAPYNTYSRFIVDAMLALWCRVIVDCVGADALREVHIEFAAPDYHARYPDLFPCPVLFACDENAVVLRGNAASRPLLTHEPMLHAELVAICEKNLRQLDNESLFRARVQKVLGPMLSGNTPALEDVAGALGMASWTLRRKLRDEGTSFQELLDEMRRDLALAYMKDMGLSLGEVAYILGFSTPGAFQRAFKRWTGTTPGGYRRSLRRDS